MRTRFVLALMFVGCTGGPRCVETSPADRSERSAPSSLGSSPSSRLSKETRGLLIWTDSRYRVVVKTGEPDKELVLDLYISENKVLVRRLEQLRGREVIVTGAIVRVPKASVVASEDDYTFGFTDFEIRPAATP